MISHSRMSGSRWVITPSWLSGSSRPFLCTSSVYFCHLFLLSSAYFRSIPFLSFIVPIIAWNVPLVSLIFLKRSLVFPILLSSSIWGRLCYFSLLFFGTLHSNGNIFSFFLCLCLLFFSKLLVRPPQAPFCLFVFLFLGMIFIPACCTMPWTSVHSFQAFCLSDLIPWIYSSLPLYNL